MINWWLYHHYYMVKESMYLVEFNLLRYQHFWFDHILMALHNNSSSVGLCNLVKFEVLNRDNKDEYIFVSLFVQVYVYLCVVCMDWLHTLSKENELMRLMNYILRLLPTAAGIQGLTCQNSKLLTKYLIFFEYSDFVMQ